tara:strand:- start:917 stop:2119 length:1203 start_codon:yes stop_codon:yes gene_type:complete
MEHAVTGERQLPLSPSWRGLLVIATLGHQSKRYYGTRRLVELHFAGWDCLGLAWSSDVLTSNETDVAYFSRRCRIVLRQGARWGSLLNLTTPAVTSSYDYIMVMLDDLIAPPSTFNVSSFVAEARRHNLSRASPTVWGSTFGGPVTAWQSTGTSYAHTAFAQRSCAANGGHCSVRLVTWIETFMTLYTRAAWECYWEMFDDRILHDDHGVIGYGYDRCFRMHCRAHHARQGVLLNHIIMHTDTIGGHRRYNFTREGRRLSLSHTETFIAAQKQAGKIEGALRDLHNDTGTCEPRHSLGCGAHAVRRPRWNGSKGTRLSDELHTCQIERSDLTVYSPGPKYEACWHSCCCYDQVAKQPVPRSQWTVTNAELKAAVRKEYGLGRSRGAGKSGHRGKGEFGRR